MMEAAASLTLTIGELVERCASEVPTGDAVLAAAMEAGRAFDEPRRDYKPGDQAMRDEIALYFSQNYAGQLDATYGLHSGGWKVSNASNLATALADAAGLALFVACYNYIDLTDPARSVTA